MNQHLRNLLSLGLLGALSACGGGSGAPGSPSIPPPPPTTLAPLTRTVLDTREFTLKRGAGIFFNHDRLPEGTLDVFMNWNNGDIPFAIYLTEANTCPDTLSVREGACPSLAKSNDPKAKPKSFTYTVPPGKPNLAVWVINEGRVTSEGVLEVALTSREKPAPFVAPNPNDPQSGLADGPVATAFIKVRSVDVGNFKYRDPFQDRDGYWVLYKGEFVVFDLTQKNASGGECKYLSNPSWDIDDPNGVLAPRGSSNPFLLRLDVAKDEGLANIKATIDGVESNPLKIKVTTNR